MKRIGAGAPTEPGSARAFRGGGFPTANLETIAAVDRLDVEDLAAGDPQDALDGRGDVFVHPVGELDHDDRSLARSSDETASDRPCAFPELAQHHVHKEESSILVAGVYWRSTGLLLLFFFTYGAHSHGLT